MGIIELIKAEKVRERAKRVQDFTFDMEGGGMLE